MMDEGRGTRNEERRTRDDRSGQALVELAVFGTIFLMILGAMISYGLKYNLSQQAQMQAFRRALDMNANPLNNERSVSYMVIKDRHIPDPLEAFGIGTTAPVTAAASVTRNVRLDAQPEDWESLPTAVMDIETSRVNGVSSAPTRFITKSAGFRIEYNVPDDANLMKKYALIYGSVLARSTDGSWVTTDNANVDKTGNNCTTDPDTLVETCESYTIAQIRILDACVGDMIDYGSCYTQAVKLVDDSRCATYCAMTHTPSSDYDCNAICGQLTNPPNRDDTSYDSARGGAWYAADWTSTTSNGQTTYRFPVLEQMFSFDPGKWVPDTTDIDNDGNTTELIYAGIKAMGIQSDTTSRSTRDTSLRKTETPTGITTDEEMSWEDATTRTFVRNDNLDTSSGLQITYTTPDEFADQTTATTIASTVSGSSHQILQTDK